MSKLLTTIRDLQRRKAREKRGLVVAEGIRLVEEGIAAGVTFTGAVIGPTLEGTERGRALKATLAGRGVALEEVDEKTFAGLADTEHPQGILAVVEPRTWTLDALATRDPSLPLGTGPRPATFLVLDAVQDPGNVGTILRSALALGSAGVIALPGTADLQNAKVLRGSMGASFKLPNLHATDAEFGAWVAERRVALWSAEASGIDIRTAARPQGPLALLVGNEGAGVRPELAARASARVAIPLTPGAESLNVAAAAAILLWECARVG